jgi:hypothetical protein
VASAINKYDVFVFSNTPKGSFASALDFEPGIVLSIEVEIVGGHSGKTGIQIWYGTNQIIPRQADLWFTGNKTKQKVELEDPFPGGLGWRAEAYNNGARNHTFYVTVETDPLGLAVLFPPVLLLRQAGEQAAV